jgi:hypothetical protein
VNLLGSEGCQLAVVGTCRRHSNMNAGELFGRLPKNNRLAACGPQSFDCNVDLVEVQRGFALNLGYVARF